LSRALVCMYGAIPLPRDTPATHATPIPSLPTLFRSIERLRLGSRLQVDWTKREPLPWDLPLPRLVLQPLVENAVLHGVARLPQRSEEHTSELQSRENIVCRLPLEKKKESESAEWRGR